MIQTAEEFWKATSPDEKYGMLAELKKMGLDKHVYEVMRRFTKVHVTEALKIASETLIEVDGSDFRVKNFYPLENIK